MVDKDGGKIGKLEAVYFDTATEEPTFATVKVGLPGGGRLVFVPLAGARVSPQSVRVMTDKKSAKDAPSIGTDGELSGRRARDLQPLRAGLRPRSERRTPPRPQVSAVLAGLDQLTSLLMR